MKSLTGAPPRPHSGKIKQLNPDTLLHAAAAHIQMFQG